MKRTLLALFVVTGLLCGCQKPAPTPSDAGSVAISPPSDTIEAGSAAVLFTAVGSTNVAWSISPSVGTLLSFVGPTTSYLPPAPSGVLTQQTLTLTATIVNTSITATATITLTPQIPDAGPPGSLQVTISNGNPVPTPNVFIEGVLAATTALTSSTEVSLPPGIYVAWGQPEPSGDTVTGPAVLASVTSNPVTISSGNTSDVTVNYGPNPNGGTGRLWIPSCAGSSAGQVLGISGNTLHNDGGSGSIGQIKVVTDGGCAEAAAIDVNGTLWVADFADGVNGKLWGFAFLDDGGTMPPIIITTQADGGGPGSAQALAFAPSGDLWVANNTDPSGMGQLVRYTPDELTVSGSPAPASVISSAPVNGYDSISLPVDMAFSPNGSALWLLNSGNDTIVEFEQTPTGDLSASPSLVIYDDGTHWIDLNGISFDPSGNLWVTAKTSNALVELDVAGIDPSQVDGGILFAAPIAMLTTADGGQGFPFNGVSNLTFDASGNLWVVNAKDDSLIEFLDPSSYSGVVAPTLNMRFSGMPGTDNGHMQFDPPAVGQGLYP